MLRVPEAGITLAETMVVLILISLTASLSIAVNFDSSDHRMLEAEAERFAARLERAADLAMVTGETLDLNWTEDSYAFRRSDGALVKLHTVPEGLAFRSKSADVNYTIQPDATSVKAVWSFESQGRSSTIAFDGVSAKSGSTP